jgi:multiple sugar transport system ATP-binding protein
VIKTQVPSEFEIGKTLTFGVRPEHISVAKGVGNFSATLDMVERLGELGYAHCELAAAEKLIVELRGDAPVSHGKKANFAFDNKNVHFFAEN